jgi:hypothetical protein
VAAAAEIVPANAVDPEALRARRMLKPTIPVIGNEGIPMRDELTLEKRL